MPMFKSYAYFFLILAVVSVAQANIAYWGIGGGYESTDFHKTLTITTSNEGEIYNKKDDLSGTGFLGEGVLGYQWRMGQAFIATELMANLSSLKYHGYYTDTALNETSKATFTINKNYDVSVLPGFSLPNHSDLYGRIGWLRGDFHYSEYKDNALGNNIGVTQNQWLNALVTGIGTEIPLKEKSMALRLEYDHIAYQTYTNKNFPMPAGQARTIQLTPSTNQFQIVLLYALA